MSAAPQVSVIVLTRDRPELFRALLLALRQQRFHDFEVIVVGEHAGAELHGAPPSLARRLTYARCAEENISLSRNMGVALAHGEILAFIDDDATPEADWLTHLLPPFAAPDVGAVGGFVRGRNGVDFQWRGALVDRYGAHRALTAEDLPLDRPGDGPYEHFLSTVGANGAFRAAALKEIGGFNENFHYFLDESDVCLRLRQAGWRTVLAPEAEVHHAYAASTNRRENRSPRDLFQIAASRVYFSRVHGDPAWVEQKIEQFRAEQDGRLTKFVQLGRLSRRQAEEVMTRMDEGVAEGERRFVAANGGGAGRGAPSSLKAEARFIEPNTAGRPRVGLVAHGLGRLKVMRAARKLARKGAEVTVIDFSLRARRLRVKFDEGVWRHTGGVFGRESFESSLLSPQRSFRARPELARIARRRDFDIVIHPDGPAWRYGKLRAAHLSGELAGFVAEPTRLGGAAAILQALGLGTKAGAARSR